MKKNKQKKQPNPDGSMSLTGHLSELRNRIVVICLVVVVGIVVCFALSGQIIELLTHISKNTDYNFVSIKPQETLMACFTISLIGGLVIGSPIIAYEFFAFSSPGLKKKEKTFVLLALIFGFLCFVVGVFFAYKIMLPFMLRFLISFSTNIGILSQISIQEYISFIMLIFIIFGIIFELPVISVLLTSLGLIKPDWLVKARKIMIVGIFVLAALITPPDIVSQIMVAIPIIFLYEISIILSRFVYSLRRKKADMDEDDD